MNFWPARLTYSAVLCTVTLAFIHGTYKGRTYYIGLLVTRIDLSIALDFFRMICHKVLLALKILGLTVSIWIVGVVVYKNLELYDTESRPVEIDLTITRTIAHVEKNFRQSRKHHLDLLLPQSPVSQEHHTLVVMVTSAFANQDRRNAIRSTWKKSYVNSEKEFYLKFVIGTLQLNSSQKDMLLAEESLHHDILIIPDLYDAYNTLTMKVLQSLTWIDDNLNYSYVLKVDDDCFVRLDLIEKELTQRSSEKGLYWGNFAYDHYPLQHGKWKESRWFSCDYYLPYALGSGYVLSADVVHKISMLSDMMMIYNNEDASVGAWTSALDIERKHDFRFLSEACNTIVRCPCDNKLLLITLDYDTVEAIYKMENRLKSNQTLCEHQKRERNYRYNWNAIPSKCCSETCNS